MGLPQKLCVNAITNVNLFGILYIIRDKVNLIKPSFMIFR